MYSLKRTLVFNEPIGPDNVKKKFCLPCDFRDEILDDYSTDAETIETINSTSNAMGEALGARPKSGNKSGKKSGKKSGNKTEKKGHYTQEEDDATFKSKLKVRNEQELEKQKESTARKERRMESLKKFESWKNGLERELESGTKVKAQLYREKARQNSEIRTVERALEAKTRHDKARKEARSVRRATGHRRNRNRKKMKIPSREEGESSITYYTSTTATMEGTSPSDSDSLPEVDFNPEE